MHADIRGAAPSLLQGRGFRHPARTFDHVELGQPITPRLRIGFLRKIDSIGTGEPPEGF